MSYLILDRFDFTLQTAHNGRAVAQIVPLNPDRRTRTGTYQQVLQFHYEIYSRGILSQLRSLRV